MNTLNKKYQSLLNNLDLIRPKYRQKRGLIDKLGTVIKSISGNMDHDDCVEITDQLQVLETNQNNLNSQINKQIIINEKMIERFNNITNHINHQQKSLEKFLKDYQDNVQSKVDKLLFMFTVYQYLNRILYDIDLLNEHLKDVLESMTLAKLQIISKHILHPQEIVYVHQLINDQKFKIKSDEDLYELLELQNFYNGSNIIFIVKIPLFYAETFSFFHIKGLPINDTYIMKLESHYVMLNEYKYQYMSEPCPVIEQINYCKLKVLKEIKPDDCIPNVIRNEKAHCELIERNMVEEIELMEPGHLVVITKQDLPVRSTCDITKNARILKGMFLIRFNNCTVYVNNIQYISKTITYFDTINVVSTIHSKINGTNIVATWNSSKLSNRTMENMAAINLLKVKTKNSNIYSYSFSGIISMLIAIFLIYKLRINLKG